MTELETLERAKMYMEKLANGINPIDESQIPDEDVINNVRLSRCFFYVTDVLRQVIELGGISSLKNGKKLPFSLPIERRNDFAFSAQPISVSEIAKRINDLIANQNMTKLTVRAIQDWLMTLELLEEYQNGEGKTAKRPTAQGENIGITLENRTWETRTYFVVVYDLDAQHFILDNLNAIIECDRSKTENQGQPWLPDHDAYLHDLYAKGVPVGEIAKALKRNSGAIRSRLKKLGLTE